MAKKDKQQILPWSNEELETLLKDLIAHGTETSKVDFKAELETTTPEQKAELLKDVTAIANTYDDENYSDYGFIVYGVKAKTLVGVTTTETDTDKLQNTIEQILKTYISPMPQIYVTGFVLPDGKHWGAIIVPPRNSKPFMFVKDLSCASNQNKSRKRGEWFVRNGATTDPGLPEDLSRITQKQLELSLEPLKESLRTLQVRVNRTEEHYNSALFTLVERALQGSQTSNQTDEEVAAPSVVGILGMDLPSKLKQKLRTPTDAIAEEVVGEAKALRTYLEAADAGLPWTPQLNNTEGNKQIPADIEERTKALQISLAVIVLNDTKGIYTDTLLRSLKILTKTIEIPSGTQYNRIGEALRYYPLHLLLYTIFVCSTAAKKADLLKKVLEIPLKHRERGVVSAITDVYFYSYEAKALVNDAFGQRWCEPLAQRIRQTMTDNIGDMLTEFSEPEYFFKGEFVWSLSYIVECMKRGEDAEHRMPYGGLYLYLHESHDPISDLIEENSNFISAVYQQPLEEIFDMFDRNASKMSASNCHGGLWGFKTMDTYNRTKGNQT